MPKLAVITDREGRVLAAIRSDPFETATGPLEFQERPRERQTPELEYYHVEVSEELLRKSPEQLHEHLFTERKQRRGPG